ncbi:MAG: hypothetical protein AB1941_29060 [Gemmatimonadota bacterium]
MRALSTLALVALLSSCAALPAPPAEGMDPAQYDGRPLRARIVNGSGQLMVSVNRPAHVAIFEIIPGRGVGLLYPAYRGERNYLYGGLNSIFLSQSRGYYSYFQPAPLFARASREGPRYLYMIASDAPLRLGSYLGAPGALRRELGLTRFASHSPYALADDLADLVLPYGVAGDWTDDMFAVWPDRTYGGDYQAEQWIRVQCADGRIIQGPAYYVYGSCAEQAGIPPLVRDPEQPGDSSAVKEPTRQRPEPGPETGTGAAAPRPPVVVEAIPEPEPARRPGVRVPERSAERELVDAGRDREGGHSPRVERRSEPASRDSEPRVERRAEPQPQAERPEPRVERPEPRSEPTPRASAPETPRVEVSRPEPRSSEPPAR